MDSTSGEDINKKHDMDTTLQEYLGMMKGIVEQQQSNTSKCSLCSKIVSQNTFGALDRLYIEEIGMIRFCEDCKYKAVAYYTKMIFAIDDKQKSE